MLPPCHDHPPVLSMQPDFHWELMAPAYGGFLWPPEFRVDWTFGDWMPQEYPHPMTDGNWRINSPLPLPLNWGQISGMSYTVSQKGLQWDWAPGAHSGHLFVTGLPTFPSWLTPHLLPVNLDSWRFPVAWKYWWKWDTSLNGKTDVPGAQGPRHILSRDGSQPLTQLSPPSLRWGQSRVGTQASRSLPAGSPASSLSPPPRCHLSSFKKKIKFLSICHHSPLQWEMEGVVSLKEKWQDSLWCPPRCWQVGDGFIQGHRWKSLSAWPTLFLISCNHCWCFQDVVLSPQTSPLTAQV